MQTVEGGRRIYFTVKELSLDVQVEDNWANPNDGVSSLEIEIGFRHEIN